MGLLRFKARDRRPGGGGVV